MVICGFACLFSMCMTVRTSASIRSATWACVYFSELRAALAVSPKDFEKAYIITHLKGILQRHLISVNSSNSTQKIHCIAYFDTMNQYNFTFIGRAAYIGYFAKGDDIAAYVPVA